MTPDVPAWRHFSQSDLDSAYNNTAAVARSGEILNSLTARSVKTRERSAIALDLAYGPGARQTIDIFACGHPHAPMLVFLHGGYWQRNAKEMFSVLAEGPLAHGFDVAMPGYTLAPEASLTRIVEECETAIRLLRVVGPSMDVAESRLIVSGWSAGGHLAARLSEMPEVDAALAISGVFDLEPIRHSYLQAALRLSSEEAHFQSPQHRVAQATKPVSVIWGGAELPELQRQSRDYIAARATAGMPVSGGAIEGEDHFTILAQLADPTSQVTGHLLALDSGLGD
ncbi:MAG: alpha/beta hydrolase [Beijerinckiaceae bacterium]|nr:alpha/beta hydrolase [Beijerinckiaceae bacterium]MCZ8301401.1 alpha/beta hydrolase [Beijerinckiaceae bacterium]